MKDFITKKDKYFKDYANAIMTQFRSLKYGISSCCEKINLDLVTMRYELSYWQTSGDYSTLSELKSNYKKWLPINVAGDEEVCYFNINVNNYSGVGKSYHITPASSLWVLTHDLEFSPNVTTTDESGQEIQGTVVYVNATTVNVVFSTPVAGWAYLS
jgi:hypothetical protein